MVIFKQRKIIILLIKVLGNEIIDKLNLGIY
jgi:hypothetical protein